MPSSRKFDLIIFGASGFTGERVLLEVARQHAQGEHTPPLNYAICGRHQARLEAVRGKVATLLGEDPHVKSIPIFLADTRNLPGMVSVFSQARCVINCVGPYRFHGEAVVQACIASSTDYVDITGEPQFMDSMALKYHEEAQKAKSLVVHACGFDSIPADLGVVYCSKQLLQRVPTAVLHSVQCFIRFRGHPTKGAAAHYTTYECAVHGFGDVKQLARLRKQLSTRPERLQPVPRSGRPPVLKKTHFNRTEQAYVTPFPGSDASVVRNSQTLQANLKGQRQPFPFFSTYIVVGNLRRTIWLGVVGLVFTSLAKWGFGRKLLLRFPRFFTGGLFSHEGPSEEQMQGTSASMTFHVSGFSTEERAKISTPDVRMTAQVSMPEPGYVATPIFCVEAARVLLEERDRVGVEGGVLTPAAAFSETSLIERLQRNRIHFEAEAPELSA